MNTHMLLFLGLDKEDRLQFYGKQSCFIAKLFFPYVKSFATIFSYLNNKDSLNICFTIKNQNTQKKLKIKYMNTNW